MVGELVMLPVRVGVRVTRLWFRVLEETFSVTTNATGRVVELLASRSSDGAGSETLPREDFQSAAAPPVAEPELRAVSAPEPPMRDVPPADAVPAANAPPPVEPEHVSEEPVLVEEFAEPGAEQGAGAEVHVDPPWDDYQRMSAKQVIARLASTDPAELAAVQLYESTSRRRQTVMNAVERALRNANAAGSPTNQRR